MKTFICFIGIFVIVAVMFAIPIFATLSFCLDWDSFLKWLFTILVIVDFVIVTQFVVRYMENFSDD